MRPVIDSVIRNSRFYFFKDHLLLKQGKQEILHFKQINTTFTGNYSCLEYSEDTELSGPESGNSYFTGKFMMDFLFYVWVTDSLD